MYRKVLEMSFVQSVETEILTTIQHKDTENG